MSHWIFFLVLIVCQDLFLIVVPVVYSTCYMNIACESNQNVACVSNSFKDYGALEVKCKRKWFWDPSTTGRVRFERRFLSRVEGRMSRVWLIVAGRGSKVEVAGAKSRSRVQCRGRGSNVAVAGPMSRQGKMIWKRLIWKQYEGKKSFLCTILKGSQFTGYAC